MGRQANSMEHGLASMSSCPHCGLKLPEGSSFCNKCGTQVSEGELIAPRLEADASPPQLRLAGTGKVPRFTPGAADKPTCRFCKGPLDLSGEFCEQCGAPVSEAAPSHRLKRAAAAPPIVSKGSSPPVLSPAIFTGPPAAKVTSSPATLSYAPSPFVPPRPKEKASRTPSPNIPTPPRADQLRSLDGKPGKASTTMSASPPSPAQAIWVPAFAPKVLAVEPPTEVAGQLGKTVAALLRQSAALPKIAEPLPAATPILSVPLKVPVRREAVFPARPKKPFPLVLVGGIAGLLLAIGIVAGWHLFHGKMPSARAGNVTAQQAQSPAPSAETAAPTLGPLGTSPAASELPEQKPQVRAPARKSRRVKAAPVVKPAPAVSATDPKTAQLVSLQNLALQACAKGNYAEPRDANAIVYSQQALALDPSNAYTRTILENSIKGGVYQVHQSILSKDFTAAHRVADVLAQLLPGESAVAELRADLARAEKAEEESRTASQAPAPVLSFGVRHMHSGKATGDKGSYCQGTLSVVGGRLKYVGETALDGQVHSFDFACSELEVKKNSRVAFWEKGFHVRTASSNITFVPEDGSASHIRALAAACSK